MRKSAMVGITVYIALVGGVLGGAYAAFEAVIAIAPAQSAFHGEVKQAPGAPGSRKWTPVEIKREVAQLPPLAAYVAPSNTKRARIAENVQKRSVIAARPTQQQFASYMPARPAYAPVEEPRAFGPFSFKF